MHPLPQVGYGLASAGRHGPRRIGGTGSDRHIGGRAFLKRGFADSFGSLEMVASGVCQHPKDQWVPPHDPSSQRAPFLHHQPIEFPRN